MTPEQLQAAVEEARRVVKYLEDRDVRLTHLPAVLERVRVLEEALAGVVRVADRDTPEFTAARRALEEG